jgi:hypothetical protein
MDWVRAHIILYGYGVHLHKFNQRRGGQRADTIRPYNPAFQHDSPLPNSARASTLLILLYNQIRLFVGQ